MPVLTIATLTLREASRRKLLLAVAVLTVVVVLLSGWGFHKLLTVQCSGHPCGATETKIFASTLMILLMFMFSFVLALGAAFLAAPAIYAEVESGIAMA
ncbi:MAG: ABC transporter permease, partial [Chloroflexota bacterium]